MDDLRKGKVENTVDITNVEFSNEIATFLGNEIKLWNVKTIKLMRNKINDEHFQQFFHSINPISQP